MSVWNPGGIYVCTNSNLGRGSVQSLSVKINNAMASVSPAVAPARWFKEIKKGSTTP